MYILVWWIRRAVSVVCQCASIVYMLGTVLVTRFNAHIMGTCSIYNAFDFVLIVRGLIILFEHKFDDGNVNTVASKARSANKIVN